MATGPGSFVPKRTCRIRTVITVYGGLSKALERLIILRLGPAAACLEHRFGLRSLVLGFHAAAYLDTVRCGAMSKETGSSFRWQR